MAAGETSRTLSAPARPESSDAPEHASPNDGAGVSLIAGPGTFAIVAVLLISVDLAG